MFLSVFIPFSNQHNHDYYVFSGRAQLVVMIDPAYTMDEHNRCNNVHTFTVNIDCPGLSHHIFILTCH